MDSMRTDGVRTYVRGRGCMGSRRGPGRGEAGLTYSVITVYILGRLSAVWEIGCRKAEAIIKGI